jgi:hypothetical protein
VLVSGENPLLASAKARSTTTEADSATDADAMMTPPAPANDRRAARRDDRRADNPASAARESIKPGRAQPAVIGQLPPLSGFAQLVGLALGAPEFQRH